MSIQNILVAVDGSEPSDRAVDLAASLARATLATLEIVTVIDLGQLEFLETHLLTDEQLRIWQARQRKEVLQAAQDRLPDDLPPPTLHMLQGRAAPTLIAHAESVGADLILMGRTGKGALARMVEGSVSRRVAQTSPVPVVLVP